MSYAQLTLKQRFQLEILLKTEKVHKDIALFLRVAPSTISREFRRNKGSEYEARNAHAKARKRRIEAKKKTKKLLTDEILQAYVKEKLKLYWSLEQIAGGEGWGGG